jgi:hypothetical protein
MEHRKFAVLFAATILAARKLSELEAQGIHAALPGPGDHHHRCDQQDGGDHEEDREELSDQELNGVVASRFPFEFSNFADVGTPTIAEGGINVR